MLTTPEILKILADGGSVVLPDGTFVRTPADVLNDAGLTRRADLARLDRFDLELAGIAFELDHTGEPGRRAMLQAQRAAALALRNTLAVSVGKPTVA